MIEVQPAGTSSVQAKPHLFELGQIVATQGVHALVLNGQVNPIALLQRHVTGDWGDLDDSDKQLNQRAIEPTHPEDQSRVFSAYQVSEKLKIWIITEYDRSVTTLLLPSEY